MTDDRTADEVVPDSWPDEPSVDGCAPSGPEVCNEADDDCDGRTDEQLWCVVRPAQDFAVLGAIWGSAPADVWVAGSADVNDRAGGVVLRWNGHAWTDVAPAGWTYFGPIRGVAEDDLWTGALLIGDLGEPHRRALLRWDGTTWSSPWWMRSGEAVGGLWAFTSDDVWAVGCYESDIPSHSGAAFWRWNGSAWLAQPLPDGLDGSCLADIFATGPSDVWTVDDPGQGRILHWDGEAWSVMHAPTIDGPSLTGVWAADPHDVWVTGGQGELIHWDGSGWSPWSAWPGGPPVGVGPIWGFSTDDIWIAALFSDLGPVMLRWNGSTWSPAADGLSRDALAVWGASPAEVWAAGQHGMVWRWRQ